MKRTRSDHGISSDDLSSKRIVRRKVTSGASHRQSPSPNQELETHRREVRTTSSVLKYVKYSSGSGGRSAGAKYTSSSKYHSKYNEGDDAENKFDQFERRNHKSRSDMDDIGRSSEVSRHISSRERGGASNHRGGHNIRFPFNDRFEFSLRIGSLDVDMVDSELKTCLFDLFKCFGYIHIKVLGRGRERHAFINFTQREDAQSALSEMSEFVLDDVPLKTEWSKSTLMRYPEVANSTYGTRSRRGGLSTRPSTSSRSRHHEDHYDNYGGSGRESIPTPSREKSYSGREVSSRSSREVSRDVPREVSRDIPRDVPREVPRHISREVGRDIPRDVSGDVPRDIPRDVSYKISSGGSNSSPPHSHAHHSSSGYSSSSRHEPRTVVPITDPNATRTLFVGNLESDITERELRDLFGPYGRIESVDIKTQRVSGSTYAFVKFLTINDAINAKNDMHSRKYGEYRLKIGFGRGSPTGKVWIGNLTCLSDLKEVRQELDRFGLIRKLDYQDGDDHAFIQLDSLDAAQAAIASLTGYRIRNSGRTLKIDICKPMYLREDPDFHIRHGPDRSHSTDDNFPPSASFRRKSRDHEYHRTGSEGSNFRRMKDTLDDPPLKGERIVSTSASSKGRRESREENRREYLKRPHSPGGKESHSSGKRSRSEGVNGVNEYHSKRPRVMSDNNRSKERHVDRDHSRSHRDERESKRSSSNKERSESSTKLKEKVERSCDAVSDDDKGMTKISDEKNEKKEQTPHVLQPTLSDIAASKDTALKLDDVPEQLAMEAGAGGPSPMEPVVPETLNDLAILYPVAWRGNLVLKNTGFPTRMHLVGGDPAVAETLLRSREGKEYLVSLRITQRLRLEQPRLEEVNKRMASAGPSGFCVLLALPGPTPSASLSPETDSMMQLRPLKSLVSYLKQKEAAGIVALSGPEGSDTASASFDKDVVGVLHAFPPCDFSQSQLVKIAPKLGDEPAKEDHIVVLLVKGNV